MSEVWRLVRASIALREISGSFHAGKLAAVLALAVVCCGAVPAQAESPMAASTSKAAREEALRAMPLDKLTGEARAKVSDVLDKCSIYRRLPVQVCHCDPQLYLFLMDHPDVLVNIWQAMGITGMSLERTGPKAYKINDGAGTQSDLELLYRDQNTHLVYAEGIYSGPVMKRPVKGRCVVLLTSGYAQREDGSEFVTNRIDAFVHLDRVGAELVAKTFQPLVGKSADENFIEATAFLSRLSQAAEQNQAGVQRLAQHLTNVDPVLQQQFVMLTASIADKAQTRMAAAAGQTRQR
jgi:hypothetical protein